MITLAKLKTYLKITDSSQDDQLNLAITNAIGFLTAYLGYSLELNAARIASFYGYDTQFELKYTNINSISKIEYTDEDGEFSDTWTTYTISGNTKVFLERGLVKTKDSLGSVVRITYSFGYDENTCPDDLAAILYDIAATNFKSMGEVSMGDLKSETVDGDNLTFKDTVGNLSPNAIVLLDKYKNYGFSA